MQLALVAMKLVSGLSSLQLPGWTCLYQSQGPGKSVRPQSKRIQSAAAFGCKSHCAFACVGMGEGEGSSSCCAPRGGQPQCEPASPGMGLCLSGAAGLLILPSSPSQIHLPCLCMAGWLKVQPVAF